ncbi:hypothetical protein PVAND_005348 [Polypedilum vanderplanki]|uniref:G-protein coupled receptors family 1 profile domain-containing protein n=1 Tax=Polypedilum vanderplanki TaxID=319348 RepID=A0A9J6BZW6_POLVA|nr:hypothetical protein PVAND_005348 [Polypedilum vanderplanki]
MLIFGFVRILLAATVPKKLLAIWWPLKLQISKKRAKGIIIGIWVIALSITLPWALFFQLVPFDISRPDIELCLEIWPDGSDGTLYFLFANLLACYVIPMALISICYILIWIKVATRDIPGDTKEKDRIQQQSKIKVVKMLALVVILFVLSWLPLYAIFTIKKFGSPDPKMEENLNILAPIAQWLGSANSCLNPILYAFNEKYRRGFIAIIRSRKCWGRLRYYETVAITSSSASTRKSSHYNNYNSTRKAPYSPSMKSDAVSFIYDQNNMNGNSNNANSRTKHNGLSKQNSNLSRQMLLKQDSSVSRNSFMKQDSVQSTRQILANNQNKSEHMTEYLCRQDSGNSCKALLKQDSNGSILSKQNSQVSYSESKRSFSSSIDSCTDLRKESILRQNFQNAYLEQKKKTLSKQDTEISLIEENRSGSGIGNSLINSQDSCASLISTSSAMRRQRLVKQDSIFSFGEPIRSVADGKRRDFIKQDSMVSVSFADHHEII